jgi:tRNA threonylcarbamoyladenosine biosynthesis protein TsaB
LAEAVAFLLKQAELKPRELSLIIGASGPGSFTGLRVGMAFIKGLSSATGVPFVFVNVLDALSSGGSKSPLLTVIDGKKGRLYAAFYERGQRVSPYWDLSPEDLLKELKGYPFSGCSLTGNYAPLLKELYLLEDSFIQVVTNPLGTLVGLEERGVEKYLKKGSDPLGQNLFYLRESDAVAPSLPLH